MKNETWAIVGFAILSIPVIYTIYTIFIIFDIRIDTQTFIQYSTAIAFVTCMVANYYRGKKSKSKNDKPKMNSEEITLAYFQASVTYTNIDNQLDFLFN